MTERSSSHKSDGRQSSAGQSNQSARAGSFALESRPLSATVAPFVPLGPPPGLFILGPVPSIIRCWLDTNFSNETLLYAAVCTGSYKSVIDLQLATRLGIEDQIRTNREGQRVLKIPVYLPEATIQQSSSRSNSPAHQLPTLTIEFLVQDPQATADTIQIFLGSDVLRARNADIHFSLDRLTLFDDERNKLSVPLVRPEKASLFKNLVTTNVDMESSPNILDAHETSQSEKPRIGGEHAVDRKLGLVNHGQADFLDENKNEQSSAAISRPLTSSPSVIGEGRRSISVRTNIENQPSAKLETEVKDSIGLINGATPDTPSKADGGSVWGSWRRDSALGRQDSASASSNTISGYQRAGRGRGMKVLKPARINTSTTRSTSATQPPAGFDAAPARFGELGKRTGQATPMENPGSRSPTLEERSFSGETKAHLQNFTNKSRPSNPIGGASAFGWLNSGQQKQSPIAND